MTPKEISAGLEAFLRRETGAKAVRVEGLRRLTGGASRETWSLDAVMEPHPPAASPSSGEGGTTETLPLILQRDVRGQPPAMSRAFEFKLLRAAYDAGAGAPEPMFMGDDSLGGEFFLVRRIEGETLPRRLLRDDAYAQARVALTPQLGAVLAKIHAMPLAGLDELPSVEATPSVAEQQLDRHEQLFRAIAPEPHPAFELAFRWLRKQQTASNKQQNETRTLVHGDFRMGNVLFGPNGMRAILDWELAHVGDPAEDLAWMCVRSWRFGGEKPAGGIGTREELFAAYAAAGGARVDPERVRWWEVFGNLRWGIICIGQARQYLDGHSNSLELASIGRRTAETEWELLNLVG